MLLDIMNISTEQKIPFWTLDNPKKYGTIQGQTDGNLHQRQESLRLERRQYQFKSDSCYFLVISKP
jgi:hypothetical protein